MILKKSSRYFHNVKAFYKHEHQLYQSSEAQSNKKARDQATIQSVPAINRSLVNAKA